MPVRGRKISGLTNASSGDPVKRIEESMEIKTLYKVISGSSSEIEKVLNVLSPDGWRPVTMSCQGQPTVLTAILENKIMEEATLTRSSALAERIPADSALEEVQ